MVVLISELMGAFPYADGGPLKTAHSAPFAFIATAPVLGLANSLRAPLANQQETP